MSPCSQTTDEGSLEGVWNSLCYRRFICIDSVFSGKYLLLCFKLNLSLRDWYIQAVGSLRARTHTSAPPTLYHPLLHIVQLFVSYDHFLEQKHVQCSALFPLPISSSYLITLGKFLLHSSCPAPMDIFIDNMHKRLQYFLSPVTSLRWTNYICKY